MVRDAAVADIVPKMTEDGRLRQRRQRAVLAYNLGHAVFEFIEAKFGTGRHPAVPLLAAQERDRRRRGRATKKRSR